MAKADHYEMPLPARDPRHDQGYKQQVLYVLDKMVLRYLKGGEEQAFISAAVAGDAFSQAGREIAGIINHIFPGSYHGEIQVDDHQFADLNRLV